MSEERGWKRVKGGLKRLATLGLSDRIENLRRDLEVLRRRCNDDFVHLAVMLADARVREFRSQELTSLCQSEFRVFSQFGEDGILQYLLSRVPVPVTTFVEFGVGDYTEANTRFLVYHDNWSGLVMDSNRESVDRIRLDEVSYRFSLSAVCAFIRVDNVNQLIADAGIRGDIGVLSIDIDGNDYWVWRAIEVISPRIVVCEYNSVFGSRHPVSVPYEPAFSRFEKVAECLYYGASLPALCHLAEDKGYLFVGSNGAGNNAFFVRRDVAGTLKALDASTGWVDSRFRESRAEDGSLTFRAGAARLAAMADHEVVNVVTGARQRVGTLTEP